LGDLALTSAVQIRRDTAANVNAATPLSGEFAYATDTKDLSIGDGSTLGGNKLAKADQVHAASAKTTLVDADEIGLVDSAASNAVKKITWANIKIAIFSGWGAVIAAATGKTTPVDADVIAISDSEATNATKGLTFANLAAWVGSKLGPQINAQTGKTTPVDADTLVISDSAASNVSKKLTWANAKAALNTYLSGLGSLSIVAGDLLYGSSTAVLSRLAKGSDGQVLTLASGLPAWAAAASGAGTARNRIVNPAFQISSINGNTAGTVTGYSPADNWSKFHVSSAGTLTVQRVQSVTPKGAKDRLRLTVTVADASLASGEYLTISQNLIGQEVADFQYGGASAKQSLLRFLFKGPQGTYAIHLGNSATNRSYVALFTISAGQTNTDTIQTFTIPGDTTGTWLTDTGTGITLDIVLAAGATFQGTTGWQSGLILATSGISNGMGTVSAVFEIGEAGLYLDPDSTNAAPTWELPAFIDDYNKQAYTKWVAYTPTFTGFGTAASVFFESRRVGDTLEVRGKWTSGTPTATEARITLGFNGTDNNVTSDAVKVPTIQHAGNVLTSVATAATFYALIEQSVGYLTFGLQNASLAALTKQNGSVFSASAAVQTMSASVPISGW
jgi:hypothetical protein